MLEKLKQYTDKIMVPVKTSVHKLTDRLPPSLKKAFCVVLATAWVLVLAPVSLIKLIPIVGGLVLLAWLLVAVVVAAVVVDVWKSAKTPAA